MSIRLAGDWAPKQRRIDSLPFDGLTIANREGPILASPEAHKLLPKAGPSLVHNTLPAKAARFVLTLANNHLMDYGESGLRETLLILKSQGFRYVGAGLDVHSASKSLIIDHNGVRIGILSRCEVQFGIASAHKPGVADLNSSVYKTIRNLKREADLVIASIHAAAEMCPWPSPKRQNDWRSLVEAGADVVHGHHSHVPQGWENYEGGLIFYGLGNFCVDPNSWSHYPNTLWSLTPILSWTSGEAKMCPTTSVIEDFGNTVKVRNADSVETSLHQSYLDRCNRPLADNLLLQGIWQEASIRMYKSYFANWLGMGLRIANQSIDWQQLAGIIAQCTRSLLRRVVKGKGKDDANQGRHLLLYHLFACDSHNDAIATALGVLCGALEDRRNAETARLVDLMMPGQH